jgi:urease accessory protein
VAGFAHGHAHGLEAPAAASPLLYVVGFVTATILLHLAGVGIGATVRDRDAARVGAGALIAAAGALVLLG